MHNNSLFFFFLPAYFFVVAASASANGFLHPFIFGGHIVATEDPIYHSTVGLLEDGEIVCSGVLIDKDLLLTAAHCISEEKVTNEIYFGGNFSKPMKAPVRQIDRHRTHPDWNQINAYGDLALAHFEGGLPEGYTPIAVATRLLVKEGDSVDLAGYGTSKPSRVGTGSGKLRKTSVTIKDIQDGEPFLLLDQSKGHGACYGDSGGPAMAMINNVLTLLGIASYVEPADCSETSSYTKPDFYSDWIVEISAELRNPQGK